MNYHDISKIECDCYYGDFSFIADFRGKNRRYIYEQIYTPILRVNQAINNHVWHFRYYKDGSGKNDKVLGKFIEEIEALFIETTISEIDTNEKGDPVTMTSTKNKIVHTIQEELNEKILSANVWEENIYQQQSIIVLILIPRDKMSRGGESRGTAQGRSPTGHRLTTADSFFSSSDSGSQRSA